MPFDHLYFNRVRPRLAAENTDQRGTALNAGIYPGEIVEPLRRALVDREMLRAVGFDHVAERSEGFPRERGREKFE